MSETGEATRIKSAFEEIQGQPDVRISRETYERLHDEIGITDERIQELTSEILPSFNYGGVGVRLEEMATKPVLHEKMQFWSNGDEFVHIPYFFSVKAKGFGQCGDLALQLISNGKFQAWLEDTNDELSEVGKPKLEVTYAGGNARTHFVNSNHYWTGIFPEGSEPEDDMIVIDPSFQEISEISKNKYNLDWWLKAPVGYGHPIEGVVMVTKLKKDGDNNVAPDGFKYVVLGSSDVSNCCYGLGFLSKEGVSQLTPFISRIYEDGESDIYTLGKDDEVISLTDNIIPFRSNEEKNEVFGFLKTVSSFVYETDRSNFTYPMGENINTSISSDYKFYKKKVS